MENKNEIEKEVSTTEDVGEGDKFETTPIIERAREERERMEAANKKKEELLNREELIMAKRELGGTAAAGSKEETKEETPQDYAQKAIMGQLNE